MESGIDKADTRLVCPTPASKIMHQKQSVPKVPSSMVGEISAKVAVGSAPSSGKATATISTMAEFKEMMAYLKQRRLGQVAKTRARKTV